MAPIRLSNQERQRLRTKCREKLSEHINSRLGIKIDPANVRLNPVRNEPYAWKILPEQEERLLKIFSKNLSEHSVGVYKELIEGVGVSFEAVSSYQPLSTGLNSVIPLQGDVSFTGKITQLEQENAKIYEELRQSRNTAGQEMEYRRLAESDLTQMEAEHGKVKDRMQHCEITAEFYKNLTLRMLLGLNHVLPILEELKNSAQMDT
ncbi:MAG: hypothetical protein Q9165_008772 [Trypethelium subeluteriae]